MNLNRQVELLLREMPEILLAGGSGEAPLTDLLALCREDYGLSLKLIREMVRLNYRSALPPLVVDLCARFPRSIDFHLLQAQLTPALGDPLVALVRETGRKRHLAARLLSAQGRDEDALDLLQGSGTDAGFVLADGLAEHALLRTMGVREDKLLSQLEKTYGNDPRYRQYRLALSFREDGPVALVKAFEAAPMPQYPIRSQVFGWLLAARDFATAQSFHETWLRDQGNPALERDDACRLILASSIPETAEEWYHPRIAGMTDAAKSHAVYVLSVRTALALRDHGLAEMRAEKGVALFPGSLGLFRLLIEALFRQGHWDEVTARLKARREAFPDDAALSDLSAEMAQRQGRASLDRKGLKAVGHALAQGDLEAANILLQVSATPDFTDRAEALEWRMKLTAQTGDLAAACAAARALETLHPTRPGTWVTTGRIHFLAGDIAAAGRARDRFHNLRSGELNGTPLTARRDVPDLVLAATGPDPRMTARPDFDAQIDACLSEPPATQGGWMQFLYRVVHTRRLDAPPSLSEHPIPQKIMTYWEGDMSAPLTAMIEAWKAALPNWFQARFDAGSARFWIRENANPLLDLFDAADSPAGRADIFRVAYLHKEGGLYVDLDECPRRDIQDWFADAGIVLVHEPGHSTIANNFIAACPGHPVLAAAMRALQTPGLSIEGIETWMAAGPGLFAQVSAEWIWQSLGDGAPPAGLRLLRSEAYQARVATNLQLPHKYRANYWRKL